MKNCNFQEQLHPEVDPTNTFVLCWNDIVVNFYIVDENEDNILTDLGEKWIYFGV